MPEARISADTHILLLSLVAIVAIYALLMVLQVLIGPRLQRRMLMLITGGLGSCACKLQPNCTRHLGAPLDGYAPSLREITPSYACLRERSLHWSDRALHRKPVRSPGGVLFGPLRPDSSPGLRGCARYSTRGVSEKMYRYPHQAERGRRSCRTTMRLRLSSITASTFRACPQLNNPFATRLRCGLAAKKKRAIAIGCMMDLFDRACAAEPATRAGRWGGSPPRNC